MVRNDYGVILFHSTQNAIKAERALAKSGLDARLIPTPRHLSSDCGSALRFPWSEAEKVRQLLAEAGVDIAGLHHLDNSQSDKAPVDANLLDNDSPCACKPKCSLADSSAKSKRVKASWRQSRSTTK